MSISYILILDIFELIVDHFNLVNLFQIVVYILQVARYIFKHPISVKFKYAGYDIKHNHSALGSYSPAVRDADISKIINKGFQTQSKPLHKR